VVKYIIKKIIKNFIHIYSEFSLIKVKKCYLKKDILPLKTSIGVLLLGLSYPFKFLGFIIIKGMDIGVWNVRGISL